MTQNVPNKWAIDILFGQAVWTLGEDLGKGRWARGQVDGSDKGGFAKTERGRKARITKAEYEIKASRSRGGESRVQLTEYHDDGSVTVFYGDAYTSLTRFAHIRARELPVLNADNHNNAHEGN